MGVQGERNAENLDGRVGVTIQKDRSKKAGEDERGSPWVVFSVLFVVFGKRRGDTQKSEEEGGAIERGRGKPSEMLNLFLEPERRDYNLTIHDLS